jgi:SHS2 domain-containing protein
VEKRFKVIDHTADIGIEAEGSGMKQAFINSARGLFSLITDLRTVKQIEQHNIEVTAPDHEALLVNWLNELIYFFDAKEMLFSRFDIAVLTDTTLEAVVYGEKIDIKRHHLKRDVKAATYHMLKIEENDGCRVRVLFDI